MNSVCIATYNGEDYIEAQLLSILPQLDANDELIIVDDASTDATRERIKALGDTRIHLWVNDTNQGPVASFARAITLSRGDMIFLSDQDDVWVPQRLSTMSQALQQSQTLVLWSHYDCLDPQGPFPPYYHRQLSAKTATHYGKNIRTILFWGGYYGCTVVFRKEIKTLLLPIPSFIEAHDQWIGLCANMLRSNAQLEAITLHRRIHSHNSSLRKTSLWVKIRRRFALLRALFVIRYRLSNPIPLSHP